MRRFAMLAALCYVLAAAPAWAADDTKTGGKIGDEKPLTSPLKPTTMLKHDTAIVAVAFSPNGRKLLTGSADGTARLWEAASGKLQARLKHESSVLAVAFSPDSQQLLTGSNDKTARLWAAASGKPLATLRHDAGVVAVAFSPDGRQVLTGSYDHTARLWDAVSGKLRRD